MRWSRELDIVTALVEELHARPDLAVRVRRALGLLPTDAKEYGSHAPYARVADYEKWLDAKVSAKVDATEDEDEDAVFERDAARAFATAGLRVTSPAPLSKGKRS